MKTTNESGRSMVEMLGVLAIIGVLSIGGIAGYSMAMNRYRANEALDMATKFAVVLYSAKQTATATGNTFTESNYSLYSTGLTTDSTDGKNNTTPGGATISAVSVDDDKVTMTIDFGAAGVCKAAQSILGGSYSCGTGTSLSSIEFKQS